MCKSCGSLCHDVNPAREADILEFYRNTYRVVPNHKNLITTTNKLQYIFKFLNEFLKDKKGLQCLDIGAATGYLCNALRMRGHKVSGTEYTTGFRRTSEHFYGIPLSEEVDITKKYDLITMYHVFEHMVEPDKKLEKYVNLLNKDARMFVGTPYWMDTLELQSGENMIGGHWANAQVLFDHLFHPNHINLFSQQALQNIFKKTGLTIIKEYFQGYGQEYLLKLGEKKSIEPEDYQRIEDTILRQKQALVFFLKNQFQDAVNVYGDFPEAHAMLIFKVYGKDPDRQEDMLKELSPKMANHTRILTSKAIWLMQYEKYDQSISVLQQTMSIRPNVELLKLFGEIFEIQGKHKDAMQAYAKRAELHPYAWVESYDAILRNASKIPTWDEAAKQKAKDEIFDKAIKAGQVKFQIPQIGETQNGQKQEGIVVTGDKKSGDNGAKDKSVEVKEQKETEKKEDSKNISREPMAGTKV